MGEYKVIVPPMNEDDTEGAQRVFEEFLVLYQPALTHIEHFLEHVMEDAGPDYADAYKPWHKALHDLFRGVYLVAKKIPLPDPEAFTEALRMFSFDSAIQFLSDVCLSCRLSLQNDWGQRFREHINILLFSVSILNRQQQEQSLSH